MSQPHMDHNDLAQLLDSTLSEEARGSTIAHLAASDADAEVLGDAAYLLRDLDPQGGVADDEGADPRFDDADTGVDARVIPLRPPSTGARTWRRPPARWLALAAVLAGVLLVPLALSRSGSRGPGDFAALLANREAGLPTGWDQRGWSVRRGGGDPVIDNARAARLGALHTDLGLAISGGQAAETRLISEQIEQLLVDVPASGTVTPYYRDLAARAGGPKEELGKVLEDGRVAVAGFVDADFFDLGAWAAAARIAAASQDAAFFHARASRKMLDRAAALDSLDSGARATVDAIRTAAAADQPDWTVLTAQAKELLEQIGR
ncbi:MAG TPA: hypothetical protein VF006_27815 [Longimicrobium sp.]